jgi:hypothetical protein
LHLEKAVEIANKILIGIYDSDSITDKDSIFLSLTDELQFYSELHYLLG